MCFIVWDGYGWIGVGRDWDLLWMGYKRSGLMRREIKLKQILKVGDSLC